MEEADASDACPSKPARATLAVRTSATAIQRISALSTLQMLCAHSGQAGLCIAEQSLGSASQQPTELPQNLYAALPAKILSEVHMHSAMVQYNI